MVHLDKVEGHKGSMVLHEDGSIISSSGDLSSSEGVANVIINLLSHSMMGGIDFGGGGGGGQNGYVNSGAVFDNNDGGGGDHTNNSSGGVVNKWNRVTVSFGDNTYVACLSNKRIHVVKRDSSTNNTAAGVASNNTTIVEAQVHDGGDASF